MKLFDKYEVKKKDGSALDPTAEYFVLRIDTDPHARVALKRYADSLLIAGEKEFAYEILAWLEKYRFRG